MLPELSSASFVRQDLATPVSHNGQTTKPSFTARFEYFKVRPVAAGVNQAGIPLAGHDLAAFAKTKKIKGLVVPDCPIG
jgi:hypothetical protein